MGYIVAHLLSKCILDMNAQASRKLVCGKNIVGATASQRPWTDTQHSLERPFRIAL